MRFTRAASRPLPGDEEDIAFASLGELAAWIASGALTSRRLTEIYLARIDALGPKLECFAIVAHKRALAEADAADALLRGGVHLGPLHGIPYGLKDLFDTKGIATGWGAEPFRDRVPDADATIVKKLRAAGAVLLGKTTVGALAYNDLWYGGWTRNPWNLNEGSSGSSAGSASATAAGLCAFAIGTETLGSITSPSQRCGTTGLRPTFGRVSRAGAWRSAGRSTRWGRSAVCRGHGDGARRASTGRMRPTAHRSRRRSISTRRRGSPGSGSAIFRRPSGTARPTSIARRSPRRAVSGSRSSKSRCRTCLTASLMNLLYAEAAAAFEELTLSDVDDTLRWQDDGAWPNTFRKARFLSAVDHVQLDRLRYQVMLALDGLFAKVDAVIGPFMTGPMLIATNFTGHPCLHLRAGFSELATRGMASLGSGKLTTGEPQAAGRTFTVPQGISLWGRLFEEGPILNLGMALERELGVAAARPGLPS